MGIPAQLYLAFGLLAPPQFCDQPVVGGSMEQPHG
jgi:hypothetical protein